MKIDVLSLFPEMFTGVFGSSILKQAQERDAVSLSVVDFRSFADNKHYKVDDYPYGGGAGMVLRAQPIFDAVEDLKASKQNKPTCHFTLPARRTLFAAKSGRISK